MKKIIYDKYDKQIALRASEGPRNMVNVPVTTIFEILKRYQADVNIPLQRSSIILPLTASYERRTVKWMINRERHNTLKTIDGSPFSGGILANYLDMGTITEVMCCVTENPAPYKFCRLIGFEDDEQDNKLTPPALLSTPLTTNNCIQTPNSSQLNNGVFQSTLSKKSGWYTKCKNINCYCIRPPPKSPLLVCIICGKGQHPQCVNSAMRPFQNNPFVCALCWVMVDDDIFHCKATLIVMSECTLEQWIDEIERIKIQMPIKYLVYRGIYFDGFIQPAQFNEYDVVLITYDYLRMDFNDYKYNISKYGQPTTPITTTNLRFPKEHFNLLSPLKFMKFWRICYNYDQRQDCTSCNTSKYTRLESVHKWIINGAPIQTSLNDLSCMLKFLDIDPILFNYDEPLVSRIYCQENYLYKWLSQVMWHNLLDDVNIELDLPKLTIEQHWLNYSPLEKQFYLNNYDNHINRLCATATKPCLPLDTPLKYVNWKKLWPIMKPVIQLQKESFYPQYKIGKFKNIKKLSMSKIMDILIAQYNIKQIQVLHCLLIQINAIAGFYSNYIINAIEFYNKVVILSKKYADLMKSPLIQRQVLHAMYNSILLMDKHPDMYLPDQVEELKRDLREFEDNHLSTINNEMAGHPKNLQK